MRMNFRHSVGLPIVIAILLLVGALLWTKSLPHPIPGGSIKIVDARATPQADLSASTSGPAFPPVPRFDALTRYERMASTTSRPVDGVWTPAAERRLRHAVEPAMQGLRLQRVYCAQGACQIIGQLNHTGRNQDDAVRQLLDGGIQRGIRAAGFIENGNMVIDAGEGENLVFYQYTALPALIH